MREVESLPTYGIHYFEVRDRNDLPWYLGLSNRGISQYDYLDRRKPRRVFLWRQLENIYFRERKFSIEVLDPKRVCVSRRSLGSASASVTVHVWFAESQGQCKAIWSMAIAQHQFYLDRKTNRSEDQTTVRAMPELAVDLSRSCLSLSTHSSSSNLSHSGSHSSLHHHSHTESGSSESLEAARLEMLEALRQRRAGLQEKLTAKTDELRLLCLREGELTGELPPEYPPVPGQPPPAVRKRVGTSFALDETIINRIINNEEETVSALELEYEIMAKITSAALRLANESTARKGVRRQRKLSYQQSAHRLRELEHKLKQARSKAAMTASTLPKQKKKPRPLSESEGIDDYVVTGSLSSSAPSAQNSPRESSTFHHSPSGGRRQDQSPHLTRSSAPASPHRGARTGSANSTVLNATITSGSSSRPASPSRPARFGSLDRRCGNSAGRGETSKSLDQLDITPTNGEGVEARDTVAPLTHSHYQQQTSITHSPPQFATAVSSNCSPHLNSNKHSQQEQQRHRQGHSHGKQQSHSSSKLRTSNVNSHLPTQVATVSSSSHSHNTTHSSISSASSSATAASVGGQASVPSQSSSQPSAGHQHPQGSSVMTQQQQAPHGVLSAGLHSGHISRSSTGNSYGYSFAQRTGPNGRNTQLQHHHQHHQQQQQNQQYYFHPQQQQQQQQYQHHQQQLKSQQHSQHIGLETMTRVSSSQGNNTCSHNLESNDAGLYALPANGGPSHVPFSSPPIKAPLGNSQLPFTGRNHPHQQQLEFAVGDARSNSGSSSVNNSFDTRTSSDDCVDGHLTVSNRHHHHANQQTRHGHQHTLSNTSLLHNTSQHRVPSPGTNKAAETHTTPETLHTLVRTSSGRSYMETTFLGDSSSASSTTSNQENIPPKQKCFNGSSQQQLQPLRPTAGNLRASSSVTPADMAPPRLLPAADLTPLRATKSSSELPPLRATNPRGEHTVKAAMAEPLMSLGEATKLKKARDQDWYETCLDSPVSGRRSQRKPVADVFINKVSTHSSTTDSNTGNSNNSSTTYNSNGYQSPCTANDSHNSSCNSHNQSIVITTGTYQPSREVSKPFEMSDFYKYSTKYRKHNLTNGNTTCSSSNSSFSAGSDSNPLSPVLPPRAQVVVSSNRAAPPSPNMIAQQSTPAAQQKGIYHSLAPYTCEGVLVSSHEGAVVPQGSSSSGAPASAGEASPQLCSPSPQTWDGAALHQAVPATVTTKRSATLV